MPETVADPSPPSCYRLLPGPGVEQPQQLDPDPFLRRALRARALCQRSLPATRATGGRAAQGQVVLQPKGESAADLLQIAQSEILDANFGCGMGRGPIHPRPCRVPSGSLVLELIQIVHDSKYSSCPDLIRASTQPQQAVRCHIESWMAGTSPAMTKT